MQFASAFGKYRAIVISVAMFIFLDTGVLMLNFYISSQIADDATNVNLAGRQRMLSQKMVKSLYDYQQQVQAGASGEEAFREMQQAVDLFDKTLLAFSRGGDTLNASGQPIYLAMADTPMARRVVTKSLEAWQPFKRDFIRLKMLIESGNPQASVLQSLVATAHSSNLQLLKLMNDLTNELEGVARDKSSTLRTIQAVAISLAILNFFLILFHFLGQLRRSDEVAEVARRETTEILKTVREGLLLLDDQLVISAQHSESIKFIFGDREYSGMSFRDLLQSLVVESEMNTAEEYIKLLLNEQVKENLIASLNPLVDVEVNLQEPSGAYSVKHLSFRFNRTIEDGVIRHILVTVLDVTENVELRAALEDAQQDSGMQLGALKRLLHVDSHSMQSFLVESEGALIAINEILKEKAQHVYEYQDKINSSFRIMHKIKGDAGALELPHIVDMAHQFEEKLSALKSKEDLQGGDFLALTLSLNDFLSTIAELQEIVGLFHRNNAAAAPIPELKSNKPSASLDKAPIRQLADRIAKEQDKEIELQFQLKDDELLPVQHGSLIQDCVIQLVRNSVVHGIETSNERRRIGKTVPGIIRITTEREGDAVRVAVRDDGRGIDLEQIREKAIANGLYSSEELESLPTTRLMSLIFEAGFSTKNSADEHAGRGVGMDVVRANVNQLGGRIRISNRASRYCEISFLVPIDAAMPDEQIYAEAV